MKWKGIMIPVLIIFLESAFLNGMYFLINKRIITRENNLKQIQNSNEWIVQDMEKFPIPAKYRGNVSFQDDYGADRANGGHEGCDIMYGENIPGKIPVISATDGVITNLGWLYLGGYRIGITSNNGIYYYYAHLDSYAKGLAVGDEIKSGEFLGFMGSTGEGEEGTEGKFPVHLHFGIYMKDDNGNEKTVNPYQFLEKINRE